MIKTDLKVGDKVYLKDPKYIHTNFNGDWNRKFPHTDRGSGYTVTDITKNYVECTHDTMDNCMDKTCYYGQNDLHFIEKE